ncbi:MAG: amidohydrolase family protein [Fidelibacterota bacterium]
MDRILITGGTVVTLNDQGDVLDPGFVGIRGSKIGIVGHRRPEGKEWDQAVEIDASECIVIPGLINAHTHAGMTPMRGWADDMPLMPWLETKIWPMEAKMIPEDVYWGTKLAALEMLRGGVTCFNDMYWHSDQAARACREVGIRAVLSGVLIATRPDAEEQLQKALEVVTEWMGKNDNRIRFFFGPHALYTCPPAYLERVVSHAEDLGTGIHIHLSETAQEVESCKISYGGKSPVEVLQDIGVFSRPTVAAHCIHLLKSDIEIMAARKVSTVHNPSSNMKLASGIMPVEDLLGAGVNVALGTDSAASNNNLAVFTEMRMASFLQKVGKGDPTALPAPRALELATRNGAEAIGMGGRLGRIREGFDADLVLVRNRRIHASPPADPFSNLVYSLRPDDVDTVFVAGKRVLAGGEFVDVDVEEVIAKAAEIAERIRV